MFSLACLFSRSLPLSIFFLIFISCHAAAARRLATAPSRCRFDCRAIDGVDIVVLAIFLPD